MATRRRGPTDAELFREFAQGVADALDAKARKRRKLVRSAVKRTTDARLDRVVEAEFREAMDAELLATAQRRYIEEKYNTRMEHERQLSEMRLQRQLEAIDRIRREEEEELTEGPRPLFEIIEEPDFFEPDFEDADYDDFWDWSDEIADEDDTDSGGNGSGIPAGV